MGKGGGCVPSKKKYSAAASAAGRPQEGPASPEEASDGRNADEDMQSYSSSESAVVVAPPTLLNPNPNPNPNPTNQLKKVFIIYYSMYGHVEGLAKRMKKGVDAVDGVEGLLYRVTETLPPEILGQMKAPPKDESVPEISAAELVQADGMLFGFPTRYGCMAAQMKAFFDSTGQLWKEQKLAGKPAGFFVSTGTQGGGQETTAWTAITQLAHHGMLFVPVGYTFGAGMFKMDSIRGGSPYGAGVYAGDGTREPSDTELALAEHQGKYMATVVKRLSQR